MALFVLTGVLALGAGAGIGALLPDPPASRSKKVRKLTLTVTNPQSQPSPAQVKPSYHKHKPLKGGGVVKHKPELDFNDFDKSLMKMLETQPTGKTDYVSTIHRSVAEDPNYYSPPLVMPEVQPAIGPIPIPLTEQQSLPLQGGARPPTPTNNNFSASWF